MRYELTREGYEKLTEELQYLRTVRRPQITLEVKQAREYGDLRENSAYHAAREAQGILEARINQLDQQLQNCTIVEREGPLDEVGVGTRVKVHDLDFDEELTYDIVGEAEADAMNGKVSASSPVGAALHGRKLGEVAEVDAPAGKIRLKILEIMDLV